jgi:hypothetical protein
LIVPRIRYTALRAAILVRYTATFVSAVVVAKLHGDSFTSFVTNAISLPRPRSRMGRARADLRPGLRSHAHKSYVIFFRYEGDVLEIMRVIESHRDIPPLFGRDEQT